jgi:hypothetical protein
MVNAVFAIDMFTVTANAGTGGYVTGGGTYPYGTWVTLNATPYPGYKFLKWDDGYTGASREFTLTGNVTYTAKFGRIYNVGDTYHLGIYNWTIVDINDQYQATLLCQSDFAKYMQEYYERNDDYEWYNVDLRKYLNNTFYDNTFSVEDKKQIVIKDNCSYYFPATVPVAHDYVWLPTITNIYGNNRYNSTGSIVEERGTQLQWFVRKSDVEIGNLYGNHVSWTRSKASKYSLGCYCVWTDASWFSGPSKCYSDGITNNWVYARPMILINLYQN